MTSGSAYGWMSVLPCSCSIRRSSGARGRYRSTTLRAATKSATVGSRSTARRYFAAEMRTWGEERDAAVALLRAAGIATAALDADVLLAHVLGVSKEMLYAHPDTEMSLGAERRYRDLIERRAKGEPVANLPYLRDDTLEHLVGERTSLAFEPRLAVTAGKDGLELIWRAAADLQRVLAPHGAALFEIDPPFAEQVAHLLQYSLGGETSVINDLAGDARVVGITRR